MTTQNHITGILRLTSPLHVASTESGPASKNITLTMTQPVVARTGLERVPFFPGNGFRGRFRRKAAKVALDAITTNGHKVTRELYSGLTSGAISAQPDKSSLTVEEALRARDDVYMGLFGGGGRLLRSRYQVCDLVPILAATIDAGMVPAHLGETSETTWTPSRFNDGKMEPVRGYGLMHEPHILRVDDVFRVIGLNDIEHYIENATSTVAAYQAGTVDKRTSRKSSKDAAEKARAEGVRNTEVEKKGDIGNIAQVQAIAAGTPMYFRLDFDDALSDAQVGLLTRALLDTINDQSLGGWIRAGFGRYAAELLMVRNGEATPLLSRPTAEGGYVLAGEAERCQEAMRCAVSKLTVEGLTSFFANRGGVEEAA